MWFLFSPSEKKHLHHPKETLNTTRFYDNFLAQNLQEVLEKYASYLQTSNDYAIQKLFGTKHIPLEELALAQNILNSPIVDSILRYSGVAYKALDFLALNTKEQNYLKQRVLIFSNLFGILRAEDKIPYYDLKQGEGFLDFDTKNFYKQNRANFLNFLNKEKEILDLRAGFYQKCLELSQDFIIYEPIFLKNSKVVSHYAKHYRGILLKECAKSQLQSLNDLKNLEIQGLKLLNIDTKTIKNIQKNFLTYEVKND